MNSGSETPKAFLASVVLHIAVIALAVLGLPLLPTPETIVQQDSIPVDVVDIGDVTSSRTADARPGPTAPAPLPKPATAEPAPPPPPPPPPRAPEAPQVADVAPPRDVEAPPVPDQAPEPTPKPTPPAPATPPPPTPPPPTPPPPAPPPPEPDAVPTKEPPPKQVAEAPPTPAPEPRPKPPTPEPPKVETPKPDAPKPTPQKPAPQKPPEKKTQPVDSLASVLNDVAKLKGQRTPDTKSTETAQSETQTPSTSRSTSQQPASNAAHISGRLTMSEEDAVRHQIEGCWNIPTGAPAGKGSGSVTIRLALNPDGTILRASIVDTARMATDSFYRAAAESALRAVLNPKCSPLHLPPEKYDTWKDMTLSFDPRDVV
ncbi:MAG: hypothetical protein P4M00_10630 [Azospirillaceae bacterium]|nr:hypothetical protein [Azospirillaceae bacterium]